MLSSGDIVQVFVQGIDFLNQSGLQALSYSMDFRFLVFDPGDVFFDFIRLLGAGVPAAFGEL